MTTPLISVVIPAHDAARYLGEALDSVLSECAGLAPAQAADIIVVDDASHDRTAAIAASYAGRGVRLVSRPAKGGIGAARNSGVAVAGGEFLGFLDADDRWTAGRLAPMLAALRARPGRHMVFGRIRQFADPSMDSELRRRLHVPAEPMAGFLPGGMLIRRSEFDSVGRFCEETEMSEVIDWLARAQEAGFEPVLIGDVVLERRIHGANWTLQPGAFHRYTRVLKRALDRRRPREAP